MIRRVTTLLVAALVMMALALPAFAVLPQRGGVRGCRRDVHQYSGRSPVRRRGGRQEPEVYRGNHHGRPRQSRK